MLSKLKSKDYVPNLFSLKYLYQNSSIKFVEYVMQYYLS